MSRASHNPEAYEECERRGVARWLREKDGNDADDYTLLMIQQNCREAWGALTGVAHKQVSEAESGFLVNHTRSAL